MGITRWPPPKSDWLYSLKPKMEKLYTTAKTRLGADCGSDHELLIEKFKLKLKKVWKTTRSFRYDLNQIPYDCTVEVTNRFKGLDLVDRVPEVDRVPVQCYGQRFITLYRRWWPKASPRNRKARRQSGCLRKPHKEPRKKEKWKAKEKSKDILNWMQSSQRIIERQENFLKWTMQRSRGKQ